MPDYVHRTTLQYVKSGNAPDFPSATWLEIPPGSPNAIIVASVVRRYQVLEGDVLREMTRGEKDVVDAAALTAERDAKASALDDVEDVLRAFMLVVLDELNAHADRHNAITATVDGAANLAQFGAAMQAIADYPRRTATQLRNAIRGKLGS